MSRARSEDFTLGTIERPIRIAFAQGLFEARAFDKGGREAYGCTFLIENKDKDYIDTVKKMVWETMKAEWGDKAAALAKAGLIANPIKEGDVKGARSSKTGELHKGFGPTITWFRASSGIEPGVFNKRGVGAKKDEIYSGCFGKAKLHAWAWENDKGGKGVSIGVNLFQMLKDGDRLGGSGFQDGSAWVDHVEDAGEAPAETKGGAGAGGLFGGESKSPLFSDEIPF